MRLGQDQAIILRLHPYKETSLVVTVFTAGHGLQSLLAKGVNRPRSPLRGRLDLFFLCRLQFHQSRGPGPWLLTDAQVLEPFLSLRRQPSALAQAGWIAGILIRCFERDAPAPAVFHTLVAFLRRLSTQGPDPDAVALVELVILRELGLLPAPSAPELPDAVREACALVLGLNCSELEQRPWPIFPTAVHSWLGAIFAREFSLDPHRRIIALGLSGHSQQTGKA